MKLIGINLIFWDKEIYGKNEVSEDSEILAENARIKAQSAYNISNILSLGDDSGIFIERS